MALWMKLDVGILNHRKIRLVRKQPQGDSLALLWIGLLCLAMDLEAEALYISEGIPYTAEDLATALDFKIKTVKIGINLFKNYGLIDILDDGAIFINSLHERQAIDKLLLQRELGKERQRRSRGRNALVTRDKVDVTRMSRVGNADVTIENSEAELDLEEYKKEASGDTDSFSDDNKYAAFDTPPDPEPEPSIYLPQAERLANKIIHNDPKHFGNKNRAKITTGWADDIRKLVEIDGRDIATVEAVIDWCQDDDFWKANILSGAKLRKQFTTLLLQRQNNGSGGKPMTADEKRQEATKTDEGRKAYYKTQSWEDLDD